MSFSDFTSFDAGIGTWTQDQGVFSNTNWNSRVRRAYLLNAPVGVSATHALSIRVRVTGPNSGGSVVQAGGAGIVVLNPAAGSNVENAGFHFRNEGFRSGELYAVRYAPSSSSKTLWSDTNMLYVYDQAGVALRGAYLRMDLIPTAKYNYVIRCFKKHPENPTDPWSLVHQTPVPASMHESWTWPPANMLTQARVGFTVSSQYDAKVFLEDFEVRTAPVFPVSA